MPKVDCVKRSNGDHKVYSNYLSSREIDLSLDECRSCSQGERIKAEIMAEKSQPRRGKGNRKTDCEIYSQCLDVAAKKDWKLWKCDLCPHYGDKEATATKPVNTRVCGECADKVTIGPKHDLCSSCLGKKAWSKTGKKKDQRKPKKKTAAHDKPGGKKASCQGSMIVSVDFSRHAEVLNAIEKLSEEEIRPIDLQVVYIVKTYLNTMKEA